MRSGIGLLCLAAAGAVLLAGAPARAQAGPCAPDDLKCRIAHLEARMDALEAKPAPKTVYVPPPPAPEETITVWLACRHGCAEEANAACLKRGFSTGSVHRWQRLRDGSIMLRSALCKR